ncbi:vesicle transport v-SNARE 12 [Contarinia nasturtii]|uniref:vesicle transport v-SNARE 12 n=1 Tax=Contarinia nasturtii TaxID=265458 RepID=UPI0012D3C46C|nr:vesicle transport v-SNARE 12 [Contarinia nasturtii]
MADSGYDWQDHNRRLALEGRQILERTSASLARSNQVAIETENIGTEVISELDEQRESLLRSQRRLDEANADLSKSSAILRAMQRNIFYNKLTLILIIVLEIFCLIGIIILKVKK